jgi:hypothetical protein
MEVLYPSFFSFTVTRTNATRVASGDICGSPIQTKPNRSFSVMFRFAGAAGATEIIVRQKNALEIARRIGFDIRHIGTGASGRNFRKLGSLPDFPRLPANLLVAPRARRPLIFPRMFRFRFSPLAALAGLLLVFSSCERHHVGELPELQKEHFHPLETAAEPEPALPKPAPTSPTPANFFPSPHP